MTALFANSAPGAAPSMWLLTYSVGALLIGRWSATTWRFASARFWLITTNPENKPKRCRALANGCVMGRRGRPGSSRDLLGQQTGSKHLKSFPLNGAEPTSGATAEPRG